MTLSGELLRCSKRPAILLQLEEPAAGGASVKKARILAQRNPSSSPQAVQAAPGAAKALKKRSRSLEQQGDAAATSPAGAGKKGKCLESSYGCDDASAQLAVGTSAAAAVGDDALLTCEGLEREPAYVRPQQQQAQAQQRDAAKGGGSSSRDQAPHGASSSRREQQAAGAAAGAAAQAGDGDACVSLDLVPDGKEWQRLFAVLTISGAEGEQQRQQGQGQGQGPQQQQVAPATPTRREDGAGGALSCLTPVRRSFLAGEFSRVQAQLKA